MLLQQHKYSPAVYNFLKWRPTYVPSLEFYSQLEKNNSRFFFQLKFMYFNTEVCVAAGIKPAQKH